LNVKRSLVGSALLLWLAGLGPVGAGTEPERDREFLVLRGTVAAVDESNDASGAKWTDATLITTESETPVRIHVAPSEILERESFRIAVGDTLQVRVFSDETPFGVQRIRNQGTGRALRVRCLHGEPLWDSSRGPGHGGDRGGPRYRGGR
jgi:hypothetical protein